MNWLGIYDVSKEFKKYKSPERNQYDPLPTSPIYTSSHEDTMENTFYVMDPVSSDVSNSTVVIFEVSTDNSVQAKCDSVSLKQFLDSSTPSAHSGEGLSPTKYVSMRLNRTEKLLLFGSSFNATADDISQNQEPPRLQTNVQKLHEFFTNYKESKYKRKKDAIIGIRVADMIQLFENLKDDYYS